MRILMINKFLYPNGGSETYIFKLGEYLQSIGHEVQYFGMEHAGRCVGNAVNAYTSDMDFHDGSKLSKLVYPLKTIYSVEARKKIRLVLDNFKPDVCHINNFNYQLTPSIILEIEKWKKGGNQCRIIYTAHDYQLVCPNHMCNNPNTHEPCEKCLGGHYSNCVKGKCIHGSIAKSAVGMAEAIFWQWKGAYRYIDTIICCSEFLKSKLDSNPILAKKTLTLHNFVEKSRDKNSESKRYVLYFGRYSKEKGVKTLLEAARALPEIPFVFAGKGDYAEEMKRISNVQDVGYKSGEELDRLIRGAKFSICPSECYENCPFSVLESQAMETPVIGAAVGGIPELVKQGENGELFERGNADDLVKSISRLWYDEQLVKKYTEACGRLHRDTLGTYSDKLVRIYSGGGYDVVGYVGKKYALYFGRYSEEKGINTLLKACKELPDMQFAFAGAGPLESEINATPNIKNFGFLHGEALAKLISEAQFSVYPSEWYENCPFSVMESQLYGTPVIGANIGGIPELIDDGRNGRLFESGNVQDLKAAIRELWDHPERVEVYSAACDKLKLDDVKTYADKLIHLYGD